MRFSTAALATVASVLAGVSAMDTIEVQDRHLVYSSTKKPFWVSGTDYQPGGSSGFKDGSDPLSDAEACARDVYLFQQMGVNTIRVYSVDPELDHSQCMSLLATAGIYVILDVNSPLVGQSLNNHEPWTTYTPDYLKHVFEVMEAFACYENTLGFFAGNEVIFDTTSAKTSVNYVKAVVRDMKAYMKNHLARKNIPIGYSNADNLLYRTSFPAFLECGDEDEIIDFLGVNSYQWCGSNTFTGSGYDTLVKDYSNYSLPIIFSEYGCNAVTPRLFEETLALYSDKMTDVFSGGMVYEYVEEDNNYGLVQIGSDGSAKTLDDFTTYQKQLKKVDFDSLSIPSDAEKPVRPTTCPSASSPMFAGISDANFTLPTTLGAQYIQNGVSDSKVTCSGFKTSGLTLSTKYSITMNGQSVSDKEIKATEKLTGGVSSSGSNSTSSSSSASTSSASASSAASTGSGSAYKNSTGVATAATTIPASTELVTTEVVTQYTTYCPYATQLTVGSSTIQVTAPTTLTIPSTTTAVSTITHPASTITVGQTTVAAQVSTVPASTELTTVEVVTQFTTFCPYATQFTVGSSTISVTAPTTLTIPHTTSAVSTITHPASTITAAPAPPAGSSTVAAVSQGMTYEVVTSLTTFCPASTSIVIGGSTIHVSQATTLTIPQTQTLTSAIANTVTPVATATAIPAVGVSSAPAAGSPAESSTIAAKDSTPAAAVPTSAAETESPPGMGAPGTSAPAASIPAASAPAYGAGSSEGSSTLAAVATTPAAGAPAPATTLVTASGAVPLPSGVLPTGGAVAGNSTNYTSPIATYVPSGISQSTGGASALSVSGGLVGVVALMWLL